LRSRRRLAQRPSKAIRSKPRPPFTCQELERRLLFSLPATWTSVGAGGGGSFFEPSFNPSNANEIWVATDQTDEYHSTNGGASWTVPNFNLIQGNHAAPVQYTSTPNLLFALGPYNLPQESTDDGQTWTPIANDPAGNADSFIVNYNNPSQFFISNYSQIFFTGNGGQSYSIIASSSGYVAGADFNGSDIYLSTDQGLLISTNGGTSFSATPFATGIPSGDGIFSFAGSTSGATTTFFAVTDPDSDIYPGQEGAICYSYTGVYAFTVGQSSWTPVSGIPAGVDPAFVSMVPNDVKDITLAGGSSAAAPTVEQSTNGGATWTSLFDTTDNANIETGWQGYGGVNYGWGYGELAMGFAQNPADPGEMMITDEGGAYLSTDGGISWKAVYTTPGDLNPAASPTPTTDAYQGNGMENTSSWYLTFTSPTNILASVTDITGISSTDGGAEWSFNDNKGNSYNTTYQTIVQPGTGNLYAAVSDTHDIYQWDAYQTNTRIDAGDGAVLISTNGGSSWTMLHNFNHPVVWQEIDPNHPDTMYVSVANSTGAGGIYVTSDLQDGANSVWKQLAAPPRTEGHPLDIVVLNDGTLVVTYAGTLDSSGEFDDSSGVFVSANQGTTWTDVTANTPAMQYFDRDITIDPNDPTQSTWYVGVWATTSDPYYPQGGVYVTTNRGQTWSALPGLPDQEFSQVAFNPSNTNEMYVTTGDDGLWYSADGQSAAPTFQQVTSYPFYAPQRVFFNPYNPSQVWVTSFGYGLAVGYEATPNVTWTGKGDALSWSDPANWSDDVVPTQSSTATILAGVADIQIGGADFSVGALTSSSPLEILPGAELQLFGPAVETGALTVDPGGTLDIQNNLLTINFASSAVDPLALIQADLKTGYDSDTWDATGIISSTAQTNPGLYAIGYADGNVDAGTPAGANQIIIENTLAGDANLDGTVNFADLLSVAQNFNHVLDTHNNPIDWADGDFNYDGVVNFADLLLVSQNFNKTVAAEETAQTPSTVLASAAVAPAPLVTTPTISSPPQHVPTPHKISSKRRVPIAPMKAAQSEVTVVTTSPLVAPRVSIPRFAPQPTTFADVLPDVWTANAPPATGLLFSSATAPIAEDSPRPLL
jgi:photosystem II stability/assembly factor-like uncharacterized protein